MIDLRPSSDRWGEVRALAAAVVCVATALVGAGCGGDDDAGASATSAVPGSDANTAAATATSAVPTSGGSVLDVSTEATGAPEAGQSSGDDARGAESAAQPRQCPTADAVG